MNAVFVYVTASGELEAERIAETAVDERLAASANILGPIRSVYRWQGKVERATEVALVLKTTRDRFEALERRIKALHSYEVPSIVALDVVAGHAPYLEWIATESRAAE